MRKVIPRYEKYPFLIGKTGLDPSVALANSDPLLIQRGLIEGATMWHGMGERESMGTSPQGEDVWRGTATVIPTPDAAGVQMEVVSTSVEDDGLTSPEGTGIRSLNIHYIDPNGDEQEETITMTGQTPVVLNATNVRFVNEIHAVAVGSNDVAVGTINVYLQGSASTVYNMIYLGGNQSLVPHRMVPRAKTLCLRHWHAEEAQNKRVVMRIRSTDHYGVLVPGVFIFKDTAYIKQSATGTILITAVIPALSIIKVTGWPVVLGAEASCGWSGVLIDD